MLCCSGLIRLLLPVVVSGELQSGFWAGNRRIENQRSLTRFFSKRSVRMQNVGEATAMRFAELDAFLRKKIEHGMHLVTLDAHFHEIPLLPIEPRSE